MRFVEDGWPLLVAAGGKVVDEVELAEMCTGFEEYFKRGERYAVISTSPPEAGLTGAKERKQIAKWADSPRVREYSKRLCVGSATVVTNPLARGALIAILWLWKPACPHEAVSTLDEGIDYCLKQLAAEGVTMRKNANETRIAIHKALKAPV